MKSSEFSFSRLVDFARLSVPQLVLLCLVLFNLLTIPMPLVGQVQPYFVLMAVYYWAIYRPTIVPPALCFVVGLLMDILSGGVMGVQAFILVVVQAVVRSQRRFLMGQTYLVLWFFFGVVALAYGALLWALWGLVSWAWRLPLPALFDMGVSFLLFPFVSLALVMIHRFLPQATKSML